MGWLFFLAIIIGFLNLFTSDDSPRRTNIRKFWAYILIVFTVSSIFVFFDIRNKIGKLIVSIIKKLFCLKQNSDEINNQTYDEADSIMHNMQS